MGDVEIQTESLSAFCRQFGNYKGFALTDLVQLLRDTNEETVMQIIAHFSQTLTDVVKTLSKDPSPENAEAVWKICHKVASSSAMVGFKSYSHNTRELSHQLRANPDWQSHATEITEILNESKEILQQIQTSCPTLSRYL